MHDSKKNKTWGEIRILKSRLQTNLDFTNLADLAGSALKSFLSEILPELKML